MRDFFQKGSMNTCSWIMHDETECGERCEGNTPFCGSHNRQLRKEEQLQKQATEKRKRQIEKAKAKNLEPRPLPNKVSPKREELNKEYKILADEFKIKHPECEIKANEYCTGKTTDVHHPAGRIGSELLNAKRWKAACRSCHQYAHDHPLEAMQKGWSESRLATIKQTI